MLRSVCAFENLSETGDWSSTERRKEHSLQVARTAARTLLRDAGGLWVSLACSGEAT
jgi:hypothetical protein